MSHLSLKRGEGGGGGAALIFPSQFEFVSGWSVSPNIMHVTLREDAGWEHSFLVAHFHHHPTLRKKQWTLLSTLPASLFLANIVWLCDHNSVILPGRDIANPKITSEASDVLEARDAEVSFLMPHGVVGTCIHQEQRGLMCTAGFGVSLLSKNNNQAIRTPL